MSEQLRLIDPKIIHDACLNAPHDKEPYRWARAAIKAVLEELEKLKETKTDAV